MFGKLLMKISEKMERKIHKKSEEKAPVDIKRNDFKNQENLSATESDSIKLGDYCNSRFLNPTDPYAISGIGSINSLVNFLIYYEDDDDNNNFYNVDDNNNTGNF
jgi:hypothetical protein